MRNLQDKISLIMNSNQMNLEDYAESTKKIIGEETLAEDLNGGMILTNNRVSFCFVQELWMLAKQHKLPILKGFIGYESLEKAYSISHTQNIRPHAVDDKISLSVFHKQKKEWSTVKVNVKSVQVISSFSEDKIIVISTEVPEHFFLLPKNVNDKIITISTTWSSFIKVMCSLSLMNDKDLSDELDLLLKKIRNPKGVYEPLSSLSEIVHQINNN